MADDVFLVTIVYFGNSKKCNVIYFCYYYITRMMCATF